MPPTEKQLQRNRELQHVRDQRRRERERAARAAEGRARRAALTAAADANAAAAIALYRREKAKYLKRNAGKIAETRAAVERAIAKADYGTNPRTGRPTRLPALHLKSDPANALINALDHWGNAE